MRRGYTQHKLKNGKARSDFGFSARKCLSELATYGKNKRKLIVETKLNLYQNDVKRKVWRRRETVHDVKHMDRETPP